MRRRPLARTLPGIGAGVLLLPARVPAAGKGAKIVDLAWEHYAFVQTTQLGISCSLNKLFSTKIGQEQEAKWSFQEVLGVYPDQNSTSACFSSACSFYGDRWQKAPEWPVIKNIWRGPGLVGQDYVEAIQSAKICLGLLSKQNRDQHTMRSVEIPYISSVLCAERTEEHLAMYRGR